MPGPPAFSINYLGEATGKSPRSAVAPKVNCAGEPFSWPIRRPSPETTMRVWLRLLRLIFLFHLCSSYAIASAPPPCIKAASSSSGQFLAITSEYVAGQTALTIYKKEPFSNKRTDCTHQVPIGETRHNGQWCSSHAPQSSGTGVHSPSSEMTASSSSS
jgi:hypothetical protein